MLDMDYIIKMSKPIASIKGIDELNIGHAIVSHALFVGWENAIREMKSLIKEYSESMIYGIGTDVVAFSETIEH